MIKISIIIFTSPLISQPVNIDIQQDIIPLYYIK